MSREVTKRLMRHLERLCLEIGPRPVGSGGNHAAMNYIDEVFRAAGFTVARQEFQCPSWDHEETCLEFGGKRLAAAANAFSPSCDLKAPAAALGTVAELRDAELDGRIGILYGDLARQPLTPKGSKVYKPERDQEIIQLLEEKKPAAIITVNPRLGCLSRLVEDWDLAVPSATVPAEVGLELLGKMGEPVNLRIVTRRRPSHSANIVGKKARSRRERIVLCAHYDTKIETPGAVDNASGVAAMLTLAEMLASRDLTVGLECVAFSAEEYGPLGDPTYISHSGDEMGDILVAVNLDGIGQRVGTNTITMMAHSQAFAAEAEIWAARYPGMIWVDPWPQSNHSTFARQGVPSIAFTSHFAGVTDINHLPTDTIEWISADKLHEVTALVSEIVEGLQDKSLEWCRGAAQAGEPGQE